MNKVWICPKCKSSSTRRSNLKAHIRNCHPGEHHEPLPYDPLIREVIQNGSPRIMHQVPSVSDSLLTYTDQRDSQREQGRNLLAEYTKSLNELSDYGDALKRFKNHLTNPIEPAVLFSLMHSNKGQRPMFTSGFGHSILSPQEPHTSPVMTSYDKSPDKRKTIAFWGFEGFKCRDCGMIILGFVYDIPPLRRATESTTSKCSLAGYPDQFNQLERPRPYQENLFTHLTRCITSSLGERLYLYCREVIASQNYNEFFKSQRALESILGIPDKFNRIKLESISSGHWAMRSKKEGRTLLLPNELGAFLQMVYASYALVHITIDGRSGYYFMWIDGEKPYFQLQSENILQRMLSGDDSNLIAY